MQGGKLTRTVAYWQVTICCQETTVNFSPDIDRASVSSVIVRVLRNGWRTINCVVFVSDERSALSQCPVEDLTNLVTVRIRCVSVLHTHPHMFLYTYPHMYE